MVVLIMATGLTLGNVAGQDSLRIVGVTAISSTPYDQRVVVSILVMNKSGPVKTALIHYAVFGENFAGWQMRPASLFSSAGGYSEFRADIPDRLDDMRFGRKILLCAEVTDLRENVALSCDPKERWNPLAQSDKKPILIDDPYPPKLLSLKVVPDNPTDVQNVTVFAKLTDERGSGIEHVALLYQVSGGPIQRADMVVFTAETYAASIPPQSPGNTVWFQVEARDRVGNVARFEPWIHYNVVWAPSGTPVIRETITGFRFLINLYNIIPYRSIFVVLLSLIGIIAGVVIFRRDSIGMVRRNLLLRMDLWRTCMLLAAFVTAALYFQAGQAWLSILVLIVFTEFWGLVDPRTKGYFSILFFRRLFEGASVKNILSRLWKDPPLVCLAASYLWLIVLTVALISKSMSPSPAAAVVAENAINLVAVNIFILVALTVVGESIRPHEK